MQELLKLRRSEGSKPGARSDGATVALVVEGGGMRGVVSAGMVTALEQLGLTMAFDLVVGTSAGALAGAFLLAEQPAMGTSLYYEELISREWLHYARAMRRRPVVGLDWLLDDVMVHSRKALRWNAAVQSDIPLYAVATQLPDYVPVTLGPLRSIPELREALRASARIPLIAGKPVEISDSLYIDGSLTQGIPLKAARDIGSTHVLILLTRPAGQLREQPKWLHKFMIFPAMNRLLSGLGDAYAHRADNYVAELREIEALQASPNSSEILVAQLPAMSPVVRQLEQDPSALFTGAVDGAAAVYKALNEPVPSFYRGLAQIR